MYNWRDSGASPRRLGAVQPWSGSDADEPPTSGHEASKLARVRRVALVVSPSGGPSRPAPTERSAASSRCAAARLPPRPGRRPPRWARRHAGRPSCGRPSSTSRRRRAAPSSPTSRRAPRWTSGTRRSCRTCWPITVGTTVDFPNDDRHVPQRLLALEDEALRPGALRARASKSVRFDRPGVVRVFCDIHSHMNAFILVFTHRFFAVTDAPAATRSTAPAGFLHPRRLV